MGSERFSRLERFVAIIIVLFGLLAFAATIARSDELRNRGLSPDDGMTPNFDADAAMPSNAAGGPIISRNKPQTPEEILYLADEMYQNKRFNDAEKLYEQYINGPETQKTPQTVSVAYHRLGLIARKRQQYQKAQDYLILAMKTDSSQSRQITFDYAQILFDIGEFRRAGNLFQYLSSKDPDNLQVNYFYGLSLLHQGAYRQAYPVLLKTLGQEQACSLIAVQAKKRGENELAAEMENVIDQIYAQRDQMFFMDSDAACAQPKVTTPPTPMFTAIAPPPSLEINIPETAAQKPLWGEEIATIEGFATADEAPSVEGFASSKEAVSAEGFASSKEVATLENRLATEMEAPVPPVETESAGDSASNTNVAPVQSPVPEMIATIPALEKPAQNNSAARETTLPAVPAASVLPPESSANSDFALGPATAELPISPIQRAVTVSEPGHGTEPLGVNPNESFALSAVTPSCPQPGVAVVEPEPTESITVPSSRPAPNISFHERIPSADDPAALAPLNVSENSTGNNTIIDNPEKIAPATMPLLSSNPLNNPSRQSLSDLFLPAFARLLQLPQSRPDDSVSEKSAALPEAEAQIGASHPGFLFASAEPVATASSQKYITPTETTAETFLAARPVKSQQSPGANLAEAVAAGVKIDYLTPEQYNQELAKRAGTIVQSTREETEKIQSSRPFLEKTKNKAR